jgi:hypothetical protein
MSMSTSDKPLRLLQRVACTDACASLLLLRHDGGHNAQHYGILVKVVELHWHGGEEEGSGLDEKECEWKSKQVGRLTTEVHWHVLNIGRNSDNHHSDTINSMF